MKTISIKTSKMTDNLLIWIRSPFRHETLLRGFVEQEIRGRYASTMFGFVWTLVTPLANMLIYMFVFSVIFQMRLQVADAGTDSYVVYLLVGLLPWLTFAEALNNSTFIFTGNANLITKVAFPLELLPISGVIVPFVLNGIGFFMLLVYLAFKGYFCVSWFWLPLIIPIHLAFTLGFVILISSLCVFVRDVQMFLVIIMSLWFYLTPIIYPITMVPERFRSLYDLNPMTHITELYRQALILKAVQPGTLMITLGLAALSMGIGIIFFSKTRNSFADVL